MGNIQKPFRNHNSPEPSRERDLSAVMEEKEQRSGDTQIERFQSSGGESEIDHKKVCKQRSEDETSVKQT